MFGCSYYFFLFISVTIRLCSSLIFYQFPRIGAKNQDLQKLLLEWDCNHPMICSGMTMILPLPCSGQHNKPCRGAPGHNKPCRGPQCDPGAEVNTWLPVFEDVYFDYVLSHHISIWMTMIWS